MASVPSEQLLRLVELQELETELLKNRRLLAQVDEKVAGLNASLKEFEDAIETKAARTKELQQQYRTWESEVQDNGIRIQKSQEKLRSVKTNKEYQSGLKEIDELKSKSTSIEDNMIQCLEEIETAESELAEVQTDYNQQQQHLLAEKESILQEADRTRAAMGKLQSQQDGLSRQVPDRLLDIFNRVKSQQPDGCAIVRVLGAVCQGCHMNIPPQMYNELQREDSLKMCPSCERIIYWQRTEERSE